MNGIALSQVPGLREAVARQNQKRESAWKDLTFDLLGFKLRAMTVRDFALLDHFGSPFICGRTPGIGDLTFFLWALSPECERWNRRRLQWGRSFHAFLHARQVKKAVKDSEVFLKAVKLAFDYVRETFLDAPSGGKEQSKICYLASWFDLIQHEYHLPDAEVWRMPLAQMFQRIRAIQSRNGVDAPSFARAEERVKQWLVEGIRGGRFTYDDLKNGKVRFEDN